jgi:tRNA modification GTPase
MLNKLSGWNDTIVALSTAPGIGAIAVIRMSGPASMDIINRLFPSKNLAIVPANTLHLGMLQNGGEEIDEVVVGIFRAPRSYTGEDIIEISCHGSPYIQQQVLQACVSQGARLARAGEFTQRAFINGKMDLTQAEAVADLINSNTKASQKTALQNVRGGFSAILRQLREDLVSFSALIELELDFSQEDVEFADRTQFLALIKSAKDITAGLLASFQLGNVIKNGISVAIIGKPNAGKSTLLNTLLNENRAIVSDIAGTTRDTIEELLNINGVIFRLIDTAGIRLHTNDEIEAIGVKRSLEKMNAADIVLYMFDWQEMVPEELEGITADLDASGIKYLLISNKSDQADPQLLRKKFAKFHNIEFIAAKTNQGIEELKNRLFAATVSQPLASEDMVITNARHHSALQQIHSSLLQIEQAMENNIPGDLLALDIRHCLQFISEITGDVTSDTVLDYVFSKFCIGK